MTTKQQIARTIARATLKFVTDALAGGVVITTTSGSAAIQLNEDGLTIKTTPAIKTVDAE